MDNFANAEHFPFSYKYTLFSLPVFLCVYPFFWSITFQISQSNTDLLIQIFSVNKWIEYQIRTFHFSSRSPFVLHNILIQYPLRSHSHPLYNLWIWKLLVFNYNWTSLLSIVKCFINSTFPSIYYYIIYKVVIDYNTETWLHNIAYIQNCKTHWNEHLTNFNNAILLTIYWRQ